MEQTISKQVETNYFNCKGKPSVLKVLADNDYEFEVHLKHGWQKVDLGTAISEALLSVENIASIKIIHFVSIELDKTVLN